MEGSFLINVVMPFVLGVIMLGLGLSLTPDDFRRVWAMPRAVLVGLAVQSLLLPAVAVALGHLFALPPVIAVGFVLLAASPGGPTSNLYSHLADGDVALNVTLTAINSVLSIVTVPTLAGLGMWHFLGQDEQIPLQFAKVVQVLLTVLTPVGLGMAVRAQRPELAARLSRPVKIASMAFLALVIVGAVAAERGRLAEVLPQIGAPALTFNLLSLGFGYLVPRALKLDRRQATAIALEIGIHNAMLAMTVAQTVLGSTEMALPGAVYGLCMFVTGAVFVAWQRRSA